MSAPTAAPAKKKSKLKMPHLLFLMLGLILLMSLLTYIVPAGQFATDPETGALIGDEFHLLGHQTPVNIWQALNYILPGFMNSSYVISLLLISGGCVGVIMGTGAFDEMVNWALYKLQDKGVSVLVPIVFMVIAIHGGFGGGDSMIALVPLGVMMAKKLRLDPIMAVALTFFASFTGFAVGPRRISTAQLMMDVPMYSGFVERTVILLVIITIGMLYTLHYARKIAKDLGVKLVIKQMNFSSLLVALQSGKVDMVLAAMSPTNARRKSIDFSKTYYKSGQDILINKTDAKIYKDHKSFANKKVGVQNGSLQETLAKTQMKSSTTLGLTKVTDLILALKTHKVAGVVAEGAVAQAYTSNDDKLVEIPGHFNLSSDTMGTAIGFAKGSDSLVAAANKSLADIKQKNLIPQYLKTAGSYMKTNTEDTSMLHYWTYFLKGVEYTLLISAIGAFFGVLLGTIFALLRLSKHRLPHLIGVAYIEFVRGTPLMIQVMFVYFGIGIFIDIPALVAGLIAVSLNSAAYVAEIIRSGIDSIPIGQTEAARSLGLSERQTMTSVVLPQAIKNIWPALGNEFISLIKESSIVSIIGVTDLIYQLTVVQTATYKGVQPILVAMVLYFVLTFGLSKLLSHFERKMNHAA